MSFYKRLFKKIKHRYTGGSMSQQISVKSGQAWKTHYSGVKGNVRLGRDIASTIYKKLTGKNKF